MKLLSKNQHKSLKMSKLNHLWTNLLQKSIKNKIRKMNQIMGKNKEIIIENEEAIKEASRIFRQLYLITLSHFLYLSWNLKNPRREDTVFYSTIMHILQTIRETDDIVETERGVKFLYNRRSYFMLYSACQTDLKLCVAEKHSHHPVYKKMFQWH